MANGSWRWRCSCRAATCCTAVTGAPRWTCPGLHFELCYYRGIEYAIAQQAGAVRTRRARRAQAGARLPAGAHAFAPLSGEPGFPRRRGQRACQRGGSRRGLCRRAARPQPPCRSRQGRTMNRLPLLDSERLGPLPRPVPGADRAERPARVRRRPVAAATAGRVQPRHLSVVRRARADPVVVARPALRVSYPGVADQPQPAPPAQAASRGSSPSITRSSRSSAPAPRRARTTPAPGCCRR